MPLNRSFSRPIELLPLFQERVWGRESLAPFYPQYDLKQRIGEVWFSFSDNRTKTGQRLGDLIREYPCVLGSLPLPLLVKLLFTTERLSVQVHPNDAYAREHHQSLGKTEAWYVVAADSSAEVAVGFREQLSPQRFADAAHSGEIEQLLDWRRVQAGDTIFVPAGTVHAIGAGVIICEVQQNSDITYRLYDYGRGRELHLEDGINVSHLGPHRFPVAPRALTPGRNELVVCDYFRMERLRIHEPVVFPAASPYYSLLTCTKGSGQIAGEDGVAGQTWLVPALADQFELRGAGSEWILARPPLA